MPLMVLKSEEKNKRANELFLRACFQEEKGKLLSAFRLYLAAAKLGDTSCQINLGNFYADGRGIKPNRKAAIEWYTKAYRRGERSAASNLGAMFRDESKFKDALSWYERAVKLGDGDAILEIAKIHLREPQGRLHAMSRLEEIKDLPREDVTRATQKEANLLLREMKKQRV
jgi:TPR repeat protein